MASIALVHVRRARRRDMDELRRVLLLAGGVFADEAALALGRWWVWSINRDCADTVRERAAALLGDAELGVSAAVSAARVAVSRTRSAPSFSPACAPRCRRATRTFASPRRFALGDEAGLLAARSAADDEMRARALRELAADWIPPPSPAIWPAAATRCGATSCAA